jgi:hypothetical protein
VTSNATVGGVRDEHVVVPSTRPPRPRPGSASTTVSRGSTWLPMGETDALVAARFADPLPIVWVAGHDVHVEYPLGSRLLRRMRPSEMRLSPAVAWSIDVHGGAAHLDTDLRGLQLQSLSMHSGAAYIRLTLGRPAGGCTIRLSSVKDLRIDRPADVPVRVEIAKGATNVNLDARRFGAIGNGLADQTADYGTSADSYLLLVAGGADGLTVTPRP